LDEDFDNRGAGFIDPLRDMLDKYADCRVLNLDKLTYAGNLENLAGLENDSRHQFIQGDICDASAVGRISVARAAKTSTAPR
jgi:dTDP-glucose 4,6-dehydratase